MAYYTMMTMLVAWGFLALFAILGGILISYAGLATYAKLEDLVGPIRELVSAARPHYEALRDRTRTLVQTLTVEALRPRS